MRERKELRSGMGISELERELKVTVSKYPKNKSKNGKRRED